MKKNVSSSLNFKSNVPHKLEANWMFVSPSCLNVFWNGEAKHLGGELSSLAQLYMLLGFLGK